MSPNFTHFIALITSLLLSSTAFAARFAGTVTDDTGAPIADATVYHVRSQRHDHTDKLGRFAFEQVEQGDTILIDALGYTTTQLIAELVLAEAPIKISLRPLALELTTVENKA